MRIILFLFSTLLAFNLHAAVYKWTDQSGQVHYTDQWREDAKPVDLPEPSVYSPRKLPPPVPEDVGGAEDSVDEYDQLTVNAPANDETIRNNEGTVSVSLQLQPTLRQGDAIELFLDGKKLEGDFRSTSVTLSNLDRGTHSLRARVIDGSGRELITSEPVSFHLRRQSKLFPQRKATPAPRQ
jgi:hypothetical protein